MSALDDYTKAAAQYIADRIDATIFLRHTSFGGEAPPEAAVDAFLRDEGWQGRKYATDFLRASNVTPEVWAEFRQLRDGESGEVQPPVAPSPPLKSGPH